MEADLMIKRGFLPKTVQLRYHVVAVTFSMYEQVLVGNGEQMITKQYVVKLVYCVPWNYFPRAVRAIDDIMSRYQHVIGEFVLVTGSGGAFEFSVNDKLLYSKLNMQKRHAGDGEILQLFRNYIDPSIEVYPESE